MKKIVQIPILLGALAAASAGLGQGIEKQSTASDWLSDVRCLPQVMKILNAGPRAAKNQWARIATRNMDGSIVFQSPALTRGLWYKVTKFLNNEVEVERFTASISAVYKFNVDRNDPSKDICTRKKTVTSKRNFDKDFMKKAFNDNDVVKLLNEGRNGIIFVWSPAMPFSYSSNLDELGANAVANIREAAKILREKYLTDIKITYAVDPNVTKEQVLATIAREPHLDESMAKPVQALDLLLRNVNNHYPALIVYSPRGLTRYVFPGVETPEVYAEYIHRKLKELNNN